MAKSSKKEGFNADRLLLDSDQEALLALGQKKADETPAASLGDFHPVKRDGVKLIKLVEDKLIPELLPLRHKRMMKNAFTFFRGTAGLMEHDLKEQTQSQILLIICGDAHLNNFGFYASPERQLLFGLNDFDESRIGHWDSDLRRLLVSSVLIGELNGYSKKAQREIVMEAAKTYRRGIKQAQSLPLLNRFYLSYRAADLMDSVSDDSQMREVLQKIMVRAPKNNSDKALKKFTQKMPDGSVQFKEKPPRARHVNEKLKAELLAGLKTYQRTATADVQIFLINYRVTDLIRYSVGVGSFGTRCYLALLTGKDGSHLILQIKEALPVTDDLTTLSVMESNNLSADAGKRIIVAQKVLQTYSDPFLGSMKVGPRSYYIRQFRDMKDSIDATELDEAGFRAYTKICAFMLAMSHYRSPTAPMIAGYLKNQKTFDEAMTAWTMSYATQVHQDYDEFEAYLRGDRALD